VAVLEGAASAGGAAAALFSWAEDEVPVLPPLTLNPGWPAPVPAPGTVVVGTVALLP
jgi:hypothetical protein